MAINYNAIIYLTTIMIYCIAYIMHDTVFQLVHNNKYYFKPVSEELIVGRNKTFLAYKDEEERH
jgi:hypothetical protein